MITVEEIEVVTILSMVKVEETATETATKRTGTLKVTAQKTNMEKLTLSLSVLSIKPTMVIRNPTARLTSTSTRIHCSPLQLSQWREVVDSRQEAQVYFHLHKVA